MIGDNWKEVVALYQSVGRGAGVAVNSTSDIDIGNSVDQIDGAGYNFWVGRDLTGSALTEAFYAAVDKFIAENPDDPLTAHMLNYYVPNGWTDAATGIPHYDENGTERFTERPGRYPDYWDNDGDWIGNGTYAEWKAMVSGEDTSEAGDASGEEEDTAFGGWTGNADDAGIVGTPVSSDPTESVSVVTYKAKVKPGDLAWDKVKDIFMATTMISREKNYTDMIATMDVDEFLTSALYDLANIPYDELSEASPVEQEEEIPDTTLITYQDENLVDQFMQYRDFGPDFWDSTGEVAVWVAEDSTFADWLVDNGYAVSGEWDFDLTDQYVAPVDHLDEEGNFAFSAVPNQYPDYWDETGTWLPEIGTYRAFQYRILWDETPTMAAEDTHYYDENETYIFTKPADFDPDHWTSEGAWHEHALATSYTEWIESKTGEPVDV